MPATRNPSGWIASAATRRSDMDRRDRVTGESTMADAAPPPPAAPRRKTIAIYSIVAAGSAVATVLVMLLWLNILERKEEARHSFLKVVELTEDTIDPAEWGKNFPRQYDSYRRTVDVERTRHGGSEAYSKLDADPRWKKLFNGYSFSADYRE